MRSRYESRSSSSSESESIVASPTTYAAIQHTQYGAMRDTRIHNQDSLASGKKTIPIPANMQRLHKLCVCTEQRVAADNIDRGEHNDDDGDRGAAKATAGGTRGPPRARKGWGATSSRPYFSSPFRWYLVPFTLAPADAETIHGPQQQARRTKQRTSSSSPPPSLCPFVSAPAFFSHIIFYPKDIFIFILYNYKNRKWIF